MNKKVIQILLIGCLLLVTALGGCQGKTQYTTATPEGTVRLWIKANSEKWDAEKTVQLFAKEDRDVAHTSIEKGLAISQNSSFSVRNLQIKVVSQTANTAKVITRCDKILTEFYGGKKVHEEILKDVVNEYDLVKQGDEWLLKWPPH